MHTHTHTHTHIIRDITILLVRPRAERILLAGGVFFFTSHTFFPPLLYSCVLYTSALQAYDIIIIIKSSSSLLLLYLFYMYRNEKTHTHTFARESASSGTAVIVGKSLLHSPP